MRAKGMANEKLARKHLERKGLKFVTSNFQCKQGEIDLVMRHLDVLVFIEVRYRKSSRFGSAAESINQTKQKKICIAASHFLSLHNLWDLNCRFDTVTVCGTPSNNDHRIEWIQGAFENQLSI